METQIVLEAPSITQNVVDELCQKIKGDRPSLGLQEITLEATHQGHTLTVIVETDIDHGTRVQPNYFEEPQFYGGYKHIVVTDTTIHNPDWDEVLITEPHRYQIEQAAKSFLS